MRRRPLEFEVSDRVLLKVIPKRRVVRFGKRGKLSPRFIGHFEMTGVSVIAQHDRCSRGVSRLHTPEGYSRSSSCGGLRID